MNANAEAARTATTIATGTNQRRDSRVASSATIVPTPIPIHTERSCEANATAKHSVPIAAAAIRARRPFQLATATAQIVEQKNRAKPFVTASRNGPRPRA